MKDVIAVQSCVNYNDIPLAHTEKYISINKSWIEGLSPQWKHLTATRSCMYISSPLWNWDPANPIYRALEIVCTKDQRLASGKGSGQGGENRDEESDADDRHGVNGAKDTKLARDGWAWLSIRWITGALTQWNNRQCNRQLQVCG